MYEHRRYCSLLDVTGILSKRSITNNTSPSIFEVRDRIRDYAGYLESFLSEAGYVVPVAPVEYTYSSTTIPRTVNAAVWCSSPGIFQPMDSVIIRGIDISPLSAGYVADESAEVVGVFSDRITLRSRYVYDTSATIIKITGSLGILRNLNAIGAAAQVERSIFMGGNPQESDYTVRLWQEWSGGVGRIREIPRWLHELAVTPGMAVPPPGHMIGYGQRHPNDPDVAAVVTRNLRF